MTRSLFGLLNGSDFETVVLPLLPKLTQPGQAHSSPAQYRPIKRVSKLSTVERPIAFIIYGSTTVQFSTRTRQTKQ